MDVRFLAEADDPIFSVTLENESGNIVFATDTNVHQAATGHYHPGATAAIRVNFENWLAPGRYRLIAGVARAGFGAAVYDIHTTATIIVVAELAGGGMADLPNTFDIDRA